MHACYRTIIAILLMLALQLVALSSGAFAQRPLAVPGARSTIASGINDAGTIIVGVYIDTSGRDHGFVWHGSGITPSTSRARWTPKPSGSMRPAPVSWACTRTPAARPTAFCGRGAASALDVPGARSTRAFGINAAGTIIVGRYEDTSGTDHGFVWQGGSFTALDVPGARGTRALGINAAGTIVVGMYTDSSGTEHGFVWQGGSFTALFDFPGARGHPSLGDQCGWHHHRGLVQGHQRHGPRIFCGGGQSLPSTSQARGAPRPWGSMRVPPSWWGSQGPPHRRMFLSLPNERRVWAYFQLKRRIFSTQSHYLHCIKKKH